MPGSSRNRATNVNGGADAELLPHLLQFAGRRRKPAETPARALIDQFAGANAIRVALTKAEVAVPAPAVRTLINAGCTDPYLVVDVVVVLR